MYSTINATRPLCGVYLDPEGSGVRVCTTRKVYFYTYTKTYAKSIKNYKELILFYEQQMHNSFTNYYTATCFDIIVSSSGSL
jgi:hypothetical protein